MARRASGSSNASKLLEIGLAAPQVVTHRVGRMTRSGPVVSARDQREFIGMIVEKQVAFFQSWWGMFMELGKLQQSWMLAITRGTVPSVPRAMSSIMGKGIEPVRRKAVSNAKRLSRTRLK